MYEDFKSLNFWKTKRKLSRIEELMDRMRSDAVIKSNRIDNLINSIKILNNKLNDPTQFTNPFTGTTGATPGTNQSFIFCNANDDLGNPVLAQIYEGGIYIGNSGDMLPLSIGNHSISALWNGETLYQSIILTEGECQFLYFVFTAVTAILCSASEGGMTVTADIYDSGVYIGMTGVLIPLAVGIHHITAVYNSETSAEQIITLSAGETQYLNFVFTPANCYIIVHGHNPEGREIGSIIGFSNNVDIYDGVTSIGHANGVTPITILSGHHHISVVFNGITLVTQEIDITGGETQNLIFTFSRTSNTGLVVHALSEFAAMVPDEFGYYPGSIPFSYDVPVQSFTYWYCQNSGSSSSSGTFYGYAEHAFIGSSGFSQLTAHVHHTVGQIGAYGQTAPVYTYAYVSSIPYASEDL